MESKLTGCVLLLCTQLVFGDVLRYGFNLNDVESDSEKHWAVLIAGSAGWWNYRHQADICHAYQLLIQHGFAPERIITFMFDDIAHNEENAAHDGKIFNHPGLHQDVYEGVKIDYRREEVNVANFLAVLKGNASSVEGKGSGRVLQSGPNDHVFINFADHGAPYLLAFPDEELHAEDLNKTLIYMHKHQMYKQMVIYIEACESGSMFLHLPKDMNIYATTAANSQESSYACYHDDQIGVYLGDVYSVNWMEDSDKENLHTETLIAQYKKVKAETNTSHVQEFGDIKMAEKDDLAEFQGGAQNAPLTQSEESKQKFADAVRSEDVPLAILKMKLQQAKTEVEEQVLLHKLQWLQQNRDHVDALMSHIVTMATGSRETFVKLLGTRHVLQDHACYRTAVNEFDARCVDISKNDYALRRLYLLVNLCQENVGTEAIVKTIRKVCHSMPYF